MRLSSTGVWRIATALALLSALFVPRAARAQAPSRTSSLSWVRLDGAESCPAGPELARAVEARLGRDVFVSTSSAEVAVEGRAERRIDGDSRRWRAVLRMTDTRGDVIGDRVLESSADSCDELGRIAAIAIALMIDPVTPAPPAPAAPSTASPETPARQPVPRRALPWRFVVDASLLGALGVVPGFGVGGLGALTVEPPHFVPLRVEGTLVPFARSETAGVRVDFLRVMGGLQICPLVLRGASVALQGCLGVAVGALFVVDTTVPLREREKVLVEGNLALSGHWRIVGPLVVRMGLHLLVPFRAVSFARADGLQQEIYAPAVVGGMLDLGAGLDF